MGINKNMAGHESTMAAITNTGVFVLPQRDELTVAQVGDNPGAIGWLIIDECDMDLGGGLRVLFPTRRTDAEFV